MHEVPEPVLRHSRQTARDDDRWRQGTGYTLAAVWPSVPSRRLELDGAVSFEALRVRRGVAKLGRVGGGGEISTISGETSRTMDLHAKFPNQTGYLVTV